MASISDKVGDLGGYLREQRQAARLSVRQLASLTGVSNPYLSQVERGLRKPSAEVLQQIAKGLRISAEVLYIRAGILDSDGLPDVEASISADPALNDRQRRALLDIYASFKAENLRANEPAAQQAVVPATPRNPRKRPAKRPAASPKSTAKPRTRAGAASPASTAENVTGSTQ